ncbi:hypothetical protein [Streptomyces sp. NPDC001966]
MARAILMLSPVIEPLLLGLEQPDVLSPQPGQFLRRTDTAIAAFWRGLGLVLANLRS